MRYFWGKKKEEEKQCSSSVDLPSAIMKNKEAISTLEKRCIHIEKKIHNQEEEARARVRAQDKRGAMLALKRKKMYETELEQLQNSRLTLEQQIMSLESAQSQQIAVGALAAGVSAQKLLNQQINVTKIDNLVEDMQEQQDLQQEVAQVLSQGAPLMDDAELLNELSALEANDIEQQITASNINVPSAPLPSHYTQQALSQQQQIASSPSSCAVLSSSSTSSAAAYANKVPPSSSANAQNVSSANTNRNNQQSDEEQLRALMGELA